MKCALLHATKDEWRGMGVVYKARQKTLGRIVAVKMIVAGRLANEQDVERFQSEAQAALHRDLKPSNILADSHDQVRITDFGLALRIEDDHGLTQTGQVLGTPSYMPPEQAQGKRALIGPASDVHALGAILYECLTGRPPFRADSVINTLEQVIHAKAASPRSLNAKIPRDLGTICLKCLEKEPRLRYGTAQLLADDLGRFLNAEPVLAMYYMQSART